MKVRVRCFASVRELFGSDQLELELQEGTTLDQLRALLAEREPAFGRLRTAQAVNRDYVDGEHVLREGDEVAFIPPISGGAPADEPPRFRMTFSHAALDPRSLEQDVRTDHDGAVVTFSGVTRDHNEGARVTGLSYEAYEEMALAEMERIFAEVAAARGDGFGRARVAHRLGPVPVGEASVLVVVAAAHRGPAFEVARLLMDELKKRVPIFKKEQLEGDGGSRWIGEVPGASGG